MEKDTRIKIVIAGISSNMSRYNLRMLLHQHKEYKIVGATGREGAWYLGRQLWEFFGAEFHHIGNEDGVGFEWARVGNLRIWSKLNYILKDCEGVVHVIDFSHPKQTIKLMRSLDGFDFSRIKSFTWLIGVTEFSKVQKKMIRNTEVLKKNKVQLTKPHRLDDSWFYYGKNNFFDVNGSNLERQYHERNRIKITKQHISLCRDCIARGEQAYVRTQLAKTPKIVFYINKIINILKDKIWIIN